MADTAHLRDYSKKYDMMTSGRLAWLLEVKDDPKPVLGRDPVIEGCEKLGWTERFFVKPDGKTISVAEAIRIYGSEHAAQQSGWKNLHQHRLTPKGATRLADELRKRGRIAQRMAPRLPVMAPAAEPAPEASAAAPPKLEIVRPAPPPETPAEALETGNASRAAAAIRLGEMVKFAERQLGRMRALYPEWVKSGQMDEARKDAELRLQADIVAFLHDAWVAE